MKKQSPKTTQKTSSASRRSKAKVYQGLTYRALQQRNAEQRQQLPQSQQDWLQQNGYRNVGWDAAIQLAEKIADLREQEELADMSLEDLFLEADRVGSKYQTAEEVTQFQQEMATVAGSIADQVDRQFPQTEVEFVDFSQPQHPSGRRRKGNNRSVTVVR